MCIGIGVIPSAISIYFRLTIPETPRYRVEKAAVAAHAVDNEGMVKYTGAMSTQEPQHVEKSVGGLGEFARFFRPWRRMKIILATTISWFCLDIAFYGINLNNSVILTVIGFNTGGTVYQQLMSNAVGNIVIALLGTVPGYWVTVFTVDRIGRRTIQLMGFSILTVLFLILGFAYHPILNASVYLFVVLFTLAQFFQNFGPNATTFIVPSEVFPTRVRSTAHGLSAACGKFGAIVAQVGFSQMVNIGGKGAFLDKLLLIFAVFMAIGGGVTLWLPETARRSLEDIEAEVEGPELPPRYQMAV